jgi:hypothetical protein
VHNRKKHELPPNKGLEDVDEGLPTGTDDKGSQPTHTSDATGYNKGLQPLVVGSTGERGFGYFGMCCSYAYAFRPEYTGGFDVVIGNPPYVKLETIKEVSVALEVQGYDTFTKRGDLYAIFVEKGFDLLKPQGIYSYIMPNKWLQAGYGEPLREFFLNRELIQLIDFGDLQIFEGATTYPCIFVARNDEPKDAFDVAVLTSANEADFDTNVRTSTETFSTKEFSGDTWVISSKTENDLLERLNNNLISLEEFVEGNANYGLKTGLTKAFLIAEETKNNILNSDPGAIAHIEPFLQGRDVSRYLNATINSYLILFKKGFTEEILGECSEEEGWNWLSKEYPSIVKWLEPFKEKGKKRSDQGDFWWELRICDYYEAFQKPKIMYQVFQVEPCFVFDESDLYCNNSMWIIPTNNKSLVGVLNSKVGWWLITQYCTQIRSGFQLIWKYFGQIPIPVLNGELDDFVEKMIDLNNELQKQTDSLLDLLQSKFEIPKLSRKLQSWHELSFKQFLKELKKKKVKLSLEEEAEWMDYFNEQKGKAGELKTQINQTDREIDAMVYELYGLNEQEIKVVEAGA